MKRKLVVFSGSGLDYLKDNGEVNIATFRNSSEAYWKNYSIEDVCTLDGWRKDRERLLSFYNERRSKLADAETNIAHRSFVDLNEKFDVVHITQNVSDLLERAGNENIYHLHGQLTQACDSFSNGNTDVTKRNIYNIGYNPINIGDKCAKNGSQLRPNVVFFNEYPFYFQEAYNFIMDADVIIVVGTSFSISYTVDMLLKTKEDCSIYYVDPHPDMFLKDKIKKYITKNATEGVPELINELLRDEK